MHPANSVFPNNLEREALEVLISSNMLNSNRVPSPEPVPLSPHVSKKRKYVLECNEDDEDEQQDRKKQCISGNFCCPVESCRCRYTRRYDMKVHFLSKHKELVEKHPHILQIKKSSKDGKKWQCPFPNCNCGYSRKGDLKAHLTKKHPDDCDGFPEILRPRSTKTNKKFQCPVPSCQCGYKRKFDLKGHLMSKHPDIASSAIPELADRKEIRDDDSQVDESSGSDTNSQYSFQESPVPDDDSVPSSPENNVSPISSFVPVVPLVQISTDFRTYPTIVIPIASRAVAGRIPMKLDFVSQ